MKIAFCSLIHSVKNNKASLKANRVFRDAQYARKAMLMQAQQEVISLRARYRV